MDGTLIDSSGAISTAYISTVREITGVIVTPEEVVDAYPVGPPRAMLGHFLGRHPTAAEVGRYHEILFDQAHSIAVYAGIEEALTKSAERVPLAVFTGASRRACEILLGSTGLLRHFADVVGGDEVARPKPEPDGIDLACSRVGVAPTSAAYVGDAPNDLEAARRSGAVAIAAAWGYQYRPGEPADEIVPHPEDILRLFP